MEIDLKRQSLAIPIKQSHDVGDARRQTVQAVKALPFDEIATGRVGIVATELAGNLAKHAGGGTIILRILQSDGEVGLEIMSIDDGPGMDVQRCLEDGYSTAGSPGTGLGAVNRMASSFEIYSLRGKGTVLVATLWPGHVPKTAFDVGAVCLPIAGEQLCGDGWAVRECESGLDIVVSDGLGHGPLAAQASDLALDTFYRKPGINPGQMLEFMHGALRPSRGAAIMTARVDVARKQLISAGIGNIAGYVMSVTKPKGVVSMNGIVGHQSVKVKEFSYDLGENDPIIFHSDGLTTHWKLDEFPGLSGRSASLIAGMMYKHFRRGRDDATVLVVRR